jgi:DNA/RNA non-specific endonuclease
MAQRDVGKLGVQDDVGGHIVGHRFVENNGDINMFPQNSNFNNSAYKTMENELADWTKNGKEVYARWTFDPPGAVRPNSVGVDYVVTDPATVMLFIATPKNL